MTLPSALSRLAYAFVSVAAATAAVLASGPARAAAISVADVYDYLDNRGPSNTGLSSGERIVIGATQVLPNGFNGTTGTARNADSLGGAPLGLSFQEQIVGGNEFALTLPAATAPASAWTLLFSNGPDQTQVSTPGIAGAPVIGYAQNVAIAGTSTPTLSWAPTPGDPVNAVRLNFYNLDRRVNGLATLFRTVNLTSGAASQFSVPAAWNLQAGTHYSVEVGLIHTRDGSGNIVGGNANTLSRSRSFFDFQLLNQAVPGPVYLPTVTPGTASTPYVFTFNISGVSNTRTTFIDPLIAIGYDYTVGAGKPELRVVAAAAGRRRPVRALLARRRWLELRAQRVGRAARRTGLRPTACRNSASSASRPMPASTRRTPLPSSPACRAASADGAAPARRPPADRLQRPVADEPCALD